MNKKGQVIFYGFMLGIVVIVLALALAPPVKEFIDDARNTTTGMDCGNSSISDFDKAACIAVDLNGWYFIGGLIMIGGIIIGARILIE